MGTNQGESSNEKKTHKTPTQMADVANRSGAESGVSDTAGRGATAKAYAGPTGNDGINGTASEENRSAKFKNPNVKQDVGPFGDAQYE